MNRATACSAPRSRRRSAAKSTPTTRAFSAFSRRIRSFANSHLFRRAIEAHLPRLLRENPRYRRRIRNLLPKYRSAMLASEIASSLVYRGDNEAAFLAMLHAHLQRVFG